MLNTLVFRSGLCVMALALGACSMLQQPAAPIEAGNSGATAGAGTDNPYGTAPYTPPPTTTAPYTPPATTTGGTYVPSYAPVDINAATHTVVRGDTVFNIAKRYQITQDNLRAWNNLGMDNNIQAGQTLRVKPAGYVAPPTTVAVVTPPVSTTTPPANTTPVTPPPTSATADAVWCGERNGLRRHRARLPSSRPATDSTAHVSSASDSVSGGRIPGRRSASTLGSIWSRCR